MRSDNVREQRAIGREFLATVIALKGFMERLTRLSCVLAHLVLICRLCIAVLRSSRIHELLGERLEFVALAAGGASEERTQRGGALHGTDVSLFCKSAWFFIKQKNTSLPALPIKALRLKFAFDFGRLSGFFTGGRRVPVGMAAFTSDSGTIFPWLLSKCR